MSNNVSDGGASLRAALAAAQNASRLYDFLPALESALFARPAQVAGLRLELERGPLRDDMLLDGLDLLLGELTAVDGPALQAVMPSSRWLTLALPGIMTYAGEHVLLRSERCSALERDVAAQLGVEPADVLSYETTLTADGAYAMSPVEAVTLCMYSRMIARGDHRVGPSEAGENHWLAGRPRSKTSLQVVKLVCVRVEAGDSPAQLVAELERWAASQPSYALTHALGRSRKVKAEFTVANVRLPWDSFQLDNYDYEASFAVALCQFAADSSGLSTGSLQAALALFTNADGDISMRACVSDAGGHPLFAHATHPVNDAELLRDKTEFLLTRAGVSVTCSGDEFFETDTVHVWTGAGPLVRVPFGVEHLRR